MTIKVALFGACLVSLGVLANPWAAEALLTLSDEVTPSGEAALGGWTTGMLVAICLGFALVALVYDVARDRAARATSNGARLLAG